MDYIEKYLGIVFLLAGGHRIFLEEQRLKEKDNFIILPENCDLLIIFIEICIGIILLFDLKYKEGVLTLLLLFLVIATIMIIYSNFDNIKNTYFDVFTYQPTFTSVVLHITYMVMIGALLIEYRKKVN